MFGCAGESPALAAQILTLKLHDGGDLTKHVEG